MASILEQVTRELEQDAAASATPAAPRAIEPVGPLRRDRDVKRALAFTPAEENHTLATETRPEELARWQQAIDSAPTEKQRQALQEGYDSTVRQAQERGVQPRPSGTGSLLEQVNAALGDMPAPQPKQEEAPPTEAELDRASRPARMTYTRGGQPVMEGDKAPPAPGRSERSEFNKGITGGLIGTNKKMFGDAAEGFGVLMDNPGLQAGGKKLAESGEKKLAVNKPGVPSFTDIRTDSIGNFLSDVHSYGTYQAGAGVGTSAPSIVTGGLTALVTANPLVGLAVGSFGPSYIQNFGDVYGSAKDDPGIKARVEKGELSMKDVAKVAAGAAVPIAALDTLSFGNVANQAVLKKAKEGFIKEIVKRTASGSLVEGTTEGSQEIISQLAQHFLGSETSLKEKFVSVMDNFFGGVFGGGLMVAGPHAAAAAKRASEAPPPAPPAPPAGTPPGAPPPGPGPAPQGAPADTTAPPPGGPPATPPPPAAPATHRLEDGTPVSPKMEDGKPVAGIWQTADGQLVEAPRAEPIQAPTPNAKLVLGNVTYDVEVTGKGRAENTARLADGQEVPIGELSTMDDDAKARLGIAAPEPADEGKPKSEAATEMPKVGGAYDKVDPQGRPHRLAKFEGRASMDAADSQMTDDEASLPGQPLGQIYPKAATTRAARIESLIRRNVWREGDDNDVGLARQQLVQLVEQADKEGWTAEKAWDAITASPAANALSAAGAVRVKKMLDGPYLGGPKQTTKEAPKPREMPAGPKPKLEGTRALQRQNRMREGAASVAQMNQIANAPDYDRLSVSKAPETGAPMVSVAGDTDTIPADQYGKSGVVVVGGNKVPVRYAVIEAEQLMASHNADGVVNKPYFDEAEPGQVRALNNGRAAGIREAYSRVTTGDYVRGLTADRDHGVKASVIKKMRQPVLVRVYPDEWNSKISNIGEASQGETLEQSPLEIALQDSAKLDNLDSYKPGEDGDVSAASNADFVRQFIEHVVPASQRGRLFDPTTGRPNKAAYDRIEAAVFQKAYGSQALTGMFAEAADPEIRTVLNALSIAAPEMAKLDGAPEELDLRPYVAEAAKTALAAKRAGAKLETYIKQQDMDRHPLVTELVQFMAQHKRSSQRIGEGLKAGARWAQSVIADDTTGDMFGDKPKFTVADALRSINDFMEQEYGQKPNGADVTQAAGNAKGQPDTGQPPGSEQTRAPYVVSRKPPAQGAVGKTEAGGSRPVRPEAGVEVKANAVMESAQKSGAFKDLRWRIERPGGIYKVSGPVVVIENIEAATKGQGAARALLERIKNAGAKVIPEEIDSVAYPFWQKMAKEGLAEGRFFLEQAQADYDASKGGTSPAETKAIGDLFDVHEKGQTKDDDFQVTHVFDPPRESEVVRIEHKARVYVAQHGWMSVPEAKKKIAEWKAHAEKQGDKYVNEERIVLSLFDTTGEWSKPWEDAGYQVYRFDIQDDPEFGDVTKFSSEFFNDLFNSFEGKDIYAILAACPCTDFAVSGARHFAAKDADGRTVKSVELVQQTLNTIEYFKPSVWALENPVGRIEKLTSLPPWRMSFNPNHFGDPYTKKTLIWGRFNANLPVAPVEPTEGSKMHSQYGGKSQATKNARSVTPEGFAYSFFMANNAHDHPLMAISNRYDRLNKDVINDALERGVTEAQIDEAVADPYYFDLDNDAAEAAIKALKPVKERQRAAKKEAAPEPKAEPTAESVEARIKRVAQGFDDEGLTFEAAKVRNLRGAVYPGVKDQDAHKRTILDDFEQELKDVGKHADRMEKMAVRFEKLSMPKEAELVRSIAKPDQKREATIRMLLDAIERPLPSIIYDYVVGTGEKRLFKDRAQAMARIRGIQQNQPVGKFEVVNAGDGVVIKVKSWPGGIDRVADMDELPAEDPEFDQFSEKNNAPARREISPKERVERERGRVYNEIWEAVAQAEKEGDTSEEAHRLRGATGRRTVVGKPNKRGERSMSFNVPWSLAEAKKRLHEYKVQRANRIRFEIAAKEFPKGTAVTLTRAEHSKRRLEGRTGIVKRIQRRNNRDTYLLISFQGDEHLLSFTHNQFSRAGKAEPLKPLEGDRPGLELAPTERGVEKAPVTADQHDINELVNQIEALADRYWEASTPEESKASLATGFWQGMEGLKQLDQQAYERIIDFRSSGGPELPPRPKPQAEKAEPTQADQLDLFSTQRSLFQPLAHYQLPRSPHEARQQDGKYDKLDVSSVVDSLLVTMGGPDRTKWNSLVYRNAADWADTQAKRTPSLEMKAKYLKAGNEIRAKHQLMARLEAATPATNPGLTAAANKADNKASEPERKAGNYQKGHYKIGPLDLSIETAAGEHRRPEWPALVAHYGYLKGTIGFDKDHLDVFINPTTPDDYSGPVFVVNQYQAGSAFDEHKVMLGYATSKEAMAAYRLNYEPGWNRGRSVVQMSMPAFRAWAHDKTRLGPKGGALKTSEAARREAEVAPPSAQVTTTTTGQRDMFAQYQAPVSTPIPGTTASSLEQIVVEPAEVRRIKVPNGKVETPQQAAQVFAQIANEPREKFQLLGLDENNVPVAYYDLFSGTLTQTSVYPREVWTHLYQTPGVKSVWLSHNHPSGVAQPSRSDEMLTEALKKMLGADIGVKYAGHVIIGDNNKAVELDSPNSPFTIPPVQSGWTEVPVLERKVVSKNRPADNPALASPGAARDYFRKLQPKTPGLLILDAQNRPLGWWSMSLEEMSKLRTGDLSTGAAKVMRMVGRNNPAAVMAYAPQGTDAAAFGKAVRNMGALLSQADVKTLDAFVQEAGRMVSLAERGDSLADAQFYRLGDTGLGMSLEEASEELLRSPLNGPSVKVLRNGWEAPERVLNHLTKTGQMSKAKAVFDPSDGTTYIIAAHNRPGDLNQMLLHERVGHEGIFNVLPGEAGLSLRGAFLEIYESRGRDIRREARAGFLQAYGFDFKEEMHRATAAAEWIAHRAERGEEQSLWKSLVAKVRGILRRYGFVNEWTDNDILHLLQLSRESLTNRHGDSANGKPYFMVGAPEGMFHSELARKVNELPQGKASPQQWKQTIRAMKGIKPAEVHWSGVEEWLDMQQGPVTKEQLVTFLADNGVRVFEEMLGEGALDPLKAEQNDLVVQLDARGYDVDQDPISGYVRGVVQRGRIEGGVPNRFYGANDLTMKDLETFDINPETEQHLFDDLPEDIKPMVARLTHLMHNFAGIHDDLLEQESRPTEYDRWVLPGGIGYTELLITVDHGNVEKIADRPMFKSGHFSEYHNVAAWIRFKERQGFDGKRVLFIEEIQSDWAQQARKYGVLNKEEALRKEKIEDKIRDYRELGMSDADRAEYFTPGAIVPSYGGYDRVISYHHGSDNPYEPWAVTVRAVQKPGMTTRRGNPITAGVHDRFAPGTPEAEGWENVEFEGPRTHTTSPTSHAIKSLRKQLADFAGMVQDGPFIGHTDQWVGLAVKRMIRYAAQHGFDRVAWTTGQQQNERYPDRPAALQAGMRKFYDEILPKVANDLLKKFGGGQVGSVKVVMPGERVSAFETPTDVTVLDFSKTIEYRAVEQGQPGFDVTPELREQGQMTMPMFALANQNGVSQVYGVRNGRLLGMAVRNSNGGPWTVYLANGGNEQLFLRGEARRMQAGSINEVNRIFNREGLELRATRPQNIPVPDRAIFDRDWVAPQADNWFRRAIIYFQNRLLLPELYEQTIAKEVGPIPQEARVHREARLAHPRAAGKIADFDHEFTEPIVAIMRQFRLSLTDVGQYLYAKHAPERNAAIEAINPQNQNGSGMSDARAAQILASFGNKTQALERIAALARGVTRHREAVMVDKGLATREAVLLLQSKYPNYVPLREMTDDEYAQQQVAPGFGVARPFNSAFGRFTEAQAEYILPALIAQAKGTISAGENAEVLRSLMRLVSYAPNPDVWSVQRYVWRPYIDDVSGEVRYAPRPVMVDAELSSRAISVPVNGERHIIVVEDQRLADAFKTSGLPVGEFSQLIGSVTRFYALMATAANPEFVMVNLLRDFQQAMVRLTGEQNTALALKVAKDVPGALWGAFAGLRAQGQLSPNAGAWHRWYRRYIEAGGHVAYRGLVDTETQHKNFMTALAEAGIYPEAATGAQRLGMRGHRAARVLGGKALSQLVVDANGAVENALRLSTFKNAVEAGFNDKDAAFLARNVTVDFNLRGDAGSRIGAYYMFFNANIQGSALLLRSIANNRAIQFAVVAMFLAGMANDWWNRRMAKKTEDNRNHYDNINAAIKERNMIFMTPSGEASITIPLPFGFNVFYVAGVNAMAVMQKAKKPVEAATDTLVAAVNAFNPFGQSPTSFLGALQLLSPTFADPLIQAMTNRNFMDKPIKPERPRFATPQADAATYFSGTPNMYVQSARVMNEATGGNEVRSGAIDVSPNMLQHWTRSIFGSAGGFAARTGEFIAGKATGEDVEKRNIPFVRRFYYEPKDFELSHRFYQNLNQAEVAYQEVRKAMEAGDTERGRAMLEENRGARMMYGSAQQVERQVATLRKEAANLRQDKRIDDDLRKRKLEQNAEQVRQAMMRFNAQFEERAER